MSIKSIKRLRNIKGKRVLVRVDYNVPIFNGRVISDQRIRNTVETLKYLLDKQCRIILISHLGRPTGKVVKELSLRPIVKSLEKNINTKVKFSRALIGGGVQRVINNLKDGEIILLENIRFYQGELENDDKFARKLASLANIYVNEAFSVSHRYQASINAIQRYLPVYGGLFLQQEIKHLDRALQNKQSLVLVMGGVKLKTKLPLMSALYSRSKYILLGGGIANTFLKYQGEEIGKSIYDLEDIDNIAKFYHNNKLKKKIIIPDDVVVKTRDNKVRVRNINEINKEDYIFDIGPKSINKYAQYIKTAQTLICNGPMGKFEERSFKHGSLAILSLIAARSKGLAYGVVGGGDTIRALEMTKMSEYVDWISSGGGASLAYLGGIKMPGLQKIIKK